jgi:hypothetical protein
MNRTRKVASSSQRFGGDGGSIIWCLYRYRTAVATFTLSFVLWLGWYGYSSLASMYIEMIQPSMEQQGAIPFQTSLAGGVTAITGPPQNSSTATVMAIATGYPMRHYERFVGSLRKTGYLGHIILIVAPNIPPNVESYLTKKGVTLKKAQYVPCSHPIKKEEEIKNNDDKELVTCWHPYPSLKNRWARFPLLRDYLEECETCTGPVLFTDTRDVFFQRDPFGPEAPVVPPNTVQLFEEHYTIRTTHQLVDKPVFQCKGIRFDKPMLCSGTTIGTRSAMLEYLRIMHKEMDEWMNDTKCCCIPKNGDDQAIHNYLYYTGKLDHIAVVIPNRMGLVHTIGAMATLILYTHQAKKREPFDLDHNGFGGWLGLQYGLTDKEGYIVDYNGERSFIVHQYDRFGQKFYSGWLDKNKDTIYAN